MGDIPATGTKSGAISAGILIGILSAGLTGLADPKIQMMTDDGVTFGEAMRLILAFAIPAVAYLKGKFEGKPE